MAGNNAPIFSKVGAITRGILLKTAANDYTGVSPYNRLVFEADATNGSFLQRLRFKPLGTNVATVARIFYNDGEGNENFNTVPTAATGTPSGTGGTILTGTYYGQVIAIDATGQQTTIGPISAGVAVTGPTGSIAWTWSAIDGAMSYRLYAGSINVSATQNYYFESATNSFTQTVMHWTDGTTSTTSRYDDPGVGNNKFYGEISLPATTISATAALVDIDYPMNFAVPPSGHIYVGLGTTVAAGWSVMPIAGNY